MSPSVDRCKIAVIGDGGVGKTALSVQTYDPTIEDAFRKQTVIDGKICLVEVIDTAGQEEFAALRNQWIREGEAFMLVYSVTSRSSFEHILSHYHVIKNIRRGRIPIFILIGNKADQTSEREVFAEEGARLALHLGCEFMETSAKTTTNVDSAFKTIVRLLRETRHFNFHPVSTPPALEQRCSCIIM